jgi:cytochrome P450
MKQMESLRLYSPVVAIPKYTNDRSQSININGQAHLIPSDTLVMLNIFAMHTNPRYWGKDSLTWRPSRWIVGHSVEASPNAERQSAQEALLEPEKGTYFPWSGGARVCVGKKFSQVEFVAVMAALFFKHRVYHVAGAGESKEQARQRVVKIVEDSLLRMTLQVRNPSLAAVAWKEV